MLTRAKWLKKVIQGSSFNSFTIYNILHCFYLVLLATKLSQAVHSRFNNYCTEPVSYKLRPSTNLHYTCQWKPVLNAQLTLKVNSSGVLIQ